LLAAYPRIFDSKQLLQTLYKVWVANEASNNLFLELEDTFDKQIILIPG